MSTTDVLKAIEENMTILEMKRQEIMSGVKSKCIISAVILCLVTGGFLFGFREPLIPFFSRGNNSIVLYAIIISVLVILLFLTIGFYNRGRIAFEKIYKDVFIRPLMDQLFPHLTYTPSSFVPESHFTQSDLFTSAYTFYGGDDHFNGQINNRTVEFSELNVVETSRQHSESKTTKNNIFSGLFLHVELDETIQNRILIDPLSMVFEKMQLPGFLMGLLKKFIPDYGNSLKTGIPEFDDNFKLYCEDETEALKVITPEMTSKILEIAEKLRAINEDKMKGDTDPQSFIENGVFLKIAINKNALYFAVYGYKLFDLTFSKTVLHSKKSLITSLSLIRMMTDLAGTVHKDNTKK